MSPFNWDVESAAKRTAHLMKFPATLGQYNSFVVYSTEGLLQLRHKSWPLELVWTSRSQLENWLRLNHYVAKDYAIGSVEPAELCFHLTGGSSHVALDHDGTNADVIETRELLKVMRGRAQYEMQMIRMFMNQLSHPLADIDDWLFVRDKSRMNGVVNVGHRFGPLPIDCPNCLRCAWFDGEDTYRKWRNGETKMVCPYCTTFFDEGLFATMECVCCNARSGFVTASVAAYQRVAKTGEEQYKCEKCSAADADTRLSQHLDAMRRFRNLRNA
jgi:hypothetical protein